MNTRRMLCTLAVTAAAIFSALAVTGGPLAAQTHTVFAESATASW